MKKKGEITNEQIIGIVVLLVSLAIIIAVYFTINWNTQVDDSVCKESVILRGTLPSIPGVKDVAPIKCKTNKICIGEKCNDYNGSKEVTSIKVEEINDVNRAISQEILACWEKMGEGKISLWDPTWNAKLGFGGVYSSCVICSRFAFDDTTLTKKGIDLQKLDVDTYMKSYKAPNSNGSYYDTILGEGGKYSVKKDSVNPSPVVITTTTNENGETKQTTTPISLTSTEARQKQSGEEIAVLFMQVSAPSNSDVWKSSLNALELGTGAISLGGVGAVVSSAVGGGKFLFSLPGAVVVATLMGVQTLQTWSNGNTAAAYCDDALSSGENPRSGCSVVRAVKYNYSELSQYCGRIESIS